MIDIRKPLELADGTPVEFNSLVDGDIVVWAHGGVRYFSQSGEHIYNGLPNLRNVQEEIPVHIKAYIDERFAALSQPVIDPDVIAVREILGAWIELEPEDIRKDDDTFQAALTAYKKHKHG